MPSAKTPPTVLSRLRNPLPSHFPRNPLKHTLNSFPDFADNYTRLAHNGLMITMQRSDDRPQPPRLRYLACWLLATGYWLLPVLSIPSSLVPSVPASEVCIRYGRGMKGISPSISPSPSNMEVWHTGGRGQVLKDTTARLTGWHALKPDGCRARTLFLITHH